MLGRKLHGGISKAKELVPVQPDFYEMRVANFNLLFSVLTERLNVTTITNATINVTYAISVNQCQLMVAVRKRGATTVTSFSSAQRNYGQGQKHHASVEVSSYINEQ